jgi:uncharacterized protein (DUF58 family)
MPDSKRFLHPEAIRRITRLDLRARHIVEGFLSGKHRSPYFGPSVELLQHREYVPGDDLRHVDWKVWARQDRLVVKQFEEDTNLRCTMVVDVSHSMQYGNGPLNKFEYAATIAASLSYLVLQQQDAVGCITFDDKVRMRVPIRSKRNHIHSVIDSLDTQSPSDKTDMYAVMREIAETVPRRGMIMLISDLLGDIEGTIKGLKLLRQRGHDILVFHVLDDDELDFEFNGAMRFDGLESDDFLNCNPRALREGYLEAMNEFLTDIRRQCASNVVDYALIRTSDPLDAVLAKYLSRRLGHRRS